MDAQTVAFLDEVFYDANDQDQTLRVRFNDGEELDLRGFFMVQDPDEDFPHCSTTVVQVIAAEPHKTKFLKPNAAILFHLNDVTRVESITTGKTLFPSMRNQ